MTEAGRNTTHEERADIYGIKRNSPRTRVVIMTGAERDTVFSRKSTAVDEVIAKPFTLAEIDETIQNVSGRAFCA
jgi:DNA-binding NarL/FixJ family response regulator